MHLFFRILSGLVLILIGAALFMNWRARSERRAEIAYHQSLHKTIRLESGKLSSDSLLAQECTCKGSGISPDLYWTNTSPSVKSYALTLTDPDVPTPAFPVVNLTHWVVYDIPPSIHSLPLNLQLTQAQQQSANFGKNSMGDQEFIAPCPPLGKHAYVFKLYALDTRLSTAVKKPLTKEQLLEWMKGHILEYGELKGYYAAP